MIYDFSEFSPVIHPDAFVHDSAVVIGQIEIGAHSSIWPTAVMRGDMGMIHVGESTSIQDGTICHITENLSKTEVGSRVTVGHKAILHGCIIEDECLIGMGSILLDNCVIGKGSFIAAGTLITVGQVIPPNSLVMGSPGKIVRQTGPKEQKIIANSWETYVEYARRYKIQISKQRG